MKRGVIVALAASAAGCAALNPAQVMETGSQLTQRSQSAPLAYTRCVIRTVEAMRFGLGDVSLPAQHRPGSADGAHEIVVDAGRDNGTLLVVRIDPDAGGSRATLWSNDQAMLIGSANLGKKIVDAGC